MDSNRPGVTGFVHIGLVVEDLEETVRFLALLGFDCGKPGVFGGEWIDRIIGLENATVEVDPERYSMGRFAALRDPEGNGIQLWQPMGPP